jgi:hypothetical protein
LNPVPGVPAALAGLVLFLLPGLLLLALLPQREREALELDEALFLAPAVSVAAAAWLALLLAELGRFSLLGAAGVVLAACAAAALLGRRRLRWPLRPPRRWSELLPALGLLALAFALQARPSEYLLGGRDPGTYVAAMALIGRTGGVLYTDPLVQAIPAEDVELFFRHPENPDFSWGRFMGFPLERPQTARVLPEFFHLFPAFGAYLFQALGVKGALATPPLFGILGSLAVFFALRRVLGAPAALLGALLLASNVVQVWFARYPVSEGMSQFLIFLGVLALAHWEQRGGAAFGALAGAALGLSLLVRIDSVLVLVPLGLYVALRRAHHELPWRRALALLLPFAALALHTGLHALLFSRKYVLDIATRPYWTQPAWFWALGAVLALGLLAAAHRWGPGLLARVEARREALQLGIVGVLVLLALYAYFLRPWLSAWAGADGNPQHLALAQPGLLHQLGFRRLAAHDAQAFLRLGWFATPLGLALGVLGQALVIRRWRRGDLFLTLLGLTFALFYCYKIRIWNDYFFAMRRFVPVVLPCLLGYAAFALHRLAQGRGARRAAAAALALGLLALFGRDTAAIAAHRDWAGSVRFVQDVARRFGPGDVVVFEQRASIHLLSLPLWAVHGVNVLELARFNPEPARLDHLLAAWRERFRNVYFVKTYRTDLCGVFLQRVEDYKFGTFEWERSLAHPPRRPEYRALSFTLSRVVPPEQLQLPALPELDVGGSDDFAVSGFFDKEGWGARTFRWTGSCASVYLPGARAGASLAVTAATDRRPTTSRALARVSLNGVALGGFEALPGWTEHRLPLPATLPPGPPVLRFDVAAWRPANVLEGSQDERDLGIMIDRIRVEPPMR